MTPTVRYPSTPITPQGAYYFLNGINPLIRLRAFDDSVVFELMGGGDIPDKFTAPESVRLVEPPKGLIAPWKFIDQQGASEDGVTNLDAVNEPVDVELKVRVRARNAKYLRKVVRHLYGSLDTKLCSELSFFTPELGRWWAPVRWAKPQIEGYGLGGHRRSVTLTLMLRADNGFWRSLDDVADFRFSYESMLETFPIDYVEERNCGPNWPIYFFPGAAGGYLYTEKGHARWHDDPNTRFFTGPRTVVAGPYRDFETETDNQVVEIVLGSFMELGAADDVWVRQGKRTDGSWNGYGTRIRIANTYVSLSAFINFHEQELKRWALFPWPAPLLGEKWRVEAGDNDNPRMFRIRRGEKTDGKALTFKDEDEVTPLGPTFRGVGFGMHAAGAVISQGTPAIIRKVSAGDATTTAQTGFIPRLNIGDQPRMDRYTLYGPGTFAIGNGPGSTDMVQFGPLLPNQVVQLRTDNRKRTVVDLTSVPPTAGELLEYKDALKDLESFAPIANIGPTLEANASVYGVVPPQGNMHRLLNGRFSRPVPRKSPGRPPELCHVAVSITGGDANSRIIAAGTPLRRYPQ